MSDIDIGISKDNRLKIAEGLKHLLADNYLEKLRKLAYST
jgi:hypothetical protein